MAPYCWLVEVSLFVYLGAHKETDPKSAFHVEMTSCGNEPERERDVYTFITLSLPPATKLGQGNIFRSVCQEFCPWGGGMHGRGGAYVAGGVHGIGHAWQGVCMAGGCAWWGCAWQGACLAGGVHGIRSMSRQYASYWNAFLFNKSSSIQTKIILPTSVQAFPESCILLLVNQITFSSSFYPCFISCRRDCF